MILKRFVADSFRNIEKCDISFEKGVNLLHGDNAQGKTNAVEGIYLFARGKSFRAREESEMIKFGESGFRIYIEYEDKNKKGSFEYALFGKERLRKKNGYKVSKISEMIGDFKAVLFYPDDLTLVKGGPEERRSFLNVAASQCYPSYLKCYSDYKKALENRNCILKMISKGFPIDDRELDSWTLSLSEYASYIYLIREEYIEKLSVYSKKVMRDISSENEELLISHETSVPLGMKNREEVRDAYLKVYRENSEKEKMAGITLYGPHRDDLLIKINGKDARYFASQGQQRSIVLSMKLAEGEVIYELFGEYPVFLFDDVLSELDGKRRKYVLGGVGEKQIIITSCDPDEFRDMKINEIDVKGGSYVHTYR